MDVEEGGGRGECRERQGRYDFLHYKVTVNRKLGKRKRLQGWDTKRQG